MCMCVRMFCVRVCDLNPGSLRQADMGEYKCLGKDYLPQMKGKTDRRISE